VGGSSRKMGIRPCLASSSTSSCELLEGSSSCWHPPSHPTS
jgi:hypothetical protein